MADDYVTYAQREAAKSLERRDLSGNEIDAIKGWAKQQDELEASRVRNWATDTDDQAMTQAKSVAEQINTAWDALADMQQAVKGREMSAEEAVGVLNSTQREIARLEALRDDVQKKVDQAIYLHEQPHQFMDEMWRSFPSMGQRPAPPY